MFTLQMNNDKRQWRRWYAAFPKLDIRCSNLGYRKRDDIMIAKRVARRSGLEFSELGFGAAAIGNLYCPISDNQAHDVLEMALYAGMSYVDTAPHYGHGLSERRVGDVIRERRDVLLSTKVGRLLKADRSLSGCRMREGFCSPMPFTRLYDYSYDGILRSWEDSRQRLGMAAIDILYVHDIGRLTHGERNDYHFDALTSGGGFRALEELRAAREIAAFGIGANEWEICVSAMDHVDMDVVLLAGRYTLLDQSALARFLPLCLERDVSVVIGGPYNSGILATGTRRSGPVHYDYGEAPPEVIEKVSKMEALCDHFRVPLAAAALQFPLAHPAVVSVIPGLGNVARVQQTVDLYLTAIPTEFWNALRYIYLLDDAAPVPVQ
jgi:D-threo-aldose 1-dehydrogenase